MPLRPKRTWWKMALWCCYAALCAAIAYATAATSWQMPWWGYLLIAVFAFNYAYTTVIERLDLIQSQLDDIASRFSDPHEAEIL